MAEGKAETAKCTKAERMLLESRRAAAQELYARADEMLAEAMDAVLEDHGIDRKGRIAQLAYQNGAAFVVLLTQEQLQAATQSAAKVGAPKPQPDADAPPPPLEPAPADEPVEAASAA